jgi:hypothetical protein
MNIMIDINVATSTITINASGLKALIKKRQKFLKNQYFIYKKTTLNIKIL